MDDRDKVPGAAAVIEPCGSARNDKVIKAADEIATAVVFRRPAFPALASFPE